MPNSNLPLAATLTAPRLLVDTTKTTVCRNLRPLLIPALGIQEARPSTDSVTLVGTVILPEAIWYVLYPFMILAIPFFKSFFFFFFNQCDSESEDNEKANHQPDLRCHSPSSSNNRPVDFTVPVKIEEHRFSPAGQPSGVTNNCHGNATPVKTNQESSGSSGSNLRWVGLSGSPRPATAVAPQGHFQVYIHQTLPALKGIKITVCLSCSYFHCFSLCD